jgi:hypothetical protein
MANFESKTMRIPLFDGKNKKFVMWWIRFKACAKVQKFCQALLQLKKLASQPCRKMQKA